MDTQKAPLIANDASQWHDPSTQYFQQPAPQEQRPAAAGGAASVNCAVCGTQFQILNAGSLGTCPNCNEKTPLSPPPVGKRYTRCQCNCLMLHSATAGAITCPRPHCRKTTIVGPPPPGKGRGLCPRCDRLIQWPLHARGGIVRCPQCRGSCIVNSKRLMIRAMLNLLLGLLLAGAGVGITVASEIAAEESGGGVYFVMYGLIIAGVLDLIVAAVYGAKLLVVPKVKPDPMLSMNAGQ